MQIAHRDWSLIPGLLFYKDVISNRFGWVESIIDIDIIAQYFNIYSIITASSLPIVRQITLTLAENSYAAETI